MDSQRNDLCAFLCRGVLRDREDLHKLWVTCIPDFETLNAPANAMMARDVKLVFNVQCSPVGSSHDSTDVHQRYEIEAPCQSSK